MEITARYVGPVRRGNQPAVWAGAVCCTLQAIFMPASAADLVVGPGARLGQPSEAAAIARPGDTVRILPGTYYDCAVWRSDDITIEGSGEATRITDRICDGKAIFVVMGNNIRIRNLTLSRARHLDGHGAAIRAEGRDLALDRLLIENNQDGIFAPGAVGGVLRIENSIFRDNGAMRGSTPSAAVRVGLLQQLIIRDTVFEGGRGKAAILSAAAWTELEDCNIVAGRGMEGATVTIEGALRAVHNRIDAGAGPRGYRAAILALPTATHHPLILMGNRLEGQGQLLLNWSSQRMELSLNDVQPGSEVATQQGASWYTARQWIRMAVSRMRLLARRIALALRRIGDKVMATHAEDSSWAVGMARAVERPKDLAVNSTPDGSGDQPHRGRLYTVEPARRVVHQDNRRGWAGVDTRSG